MSAKKASVNVAATSEKRCEFIDEAKYQGSATPASDYKPNFVSSIPLNPLYRTAST
jgi:hypothetical protein